MDDITSGHLANVRLVLPDRVVPGRIAWADGTIVEVAEGDAVPADAVDCGGDHLLPGLVELHTDNVERHVAPRPGVDWPAAAALAAHDRELAGCGITTVFDAMRVGSSTDGRPYRAYARALATQLAALRDAGALRIDHHLHLRAEVCSETLLDELAAFGPGDRVGLVSLMDHTPGQRQFRDLDKLRAYWEGKNRDMPGGFAAHVDRLRAMRDRIGPDHERGAVDFARRCGAVLASHDDTTPAQVAVSADHGVRLAEFPTTLDAARACRDAGIPVMMGAPNVIRGVSHSGNVSALDLARAGLLDILSSDYVPAGLLVAAWRLGAVWDDLPRAVRTVTAAPAAAVGLPDRGTLARGRRADLVRVSVHDGLPLVRGAWSGGRRSA
ncbi:alpha-D-ribose 1-methylphosphonate 5-triphosphate diphosphatase [Jannaschia sp. LMIT008]|uniref:alpha-D-ribose 1-methylphosphonate 5-triphosphate diphosphatase n=1 Tax=Jannaschia maritima TaxID=3032585 RepID=UPI0028114A1D|nr:alpha-D-ribose 1-methylphosphonate 5-triphosphate diphosphatase [Jannaschia sp. LMIT008]